MKTNFPTKPSGSYVLAVVLIWTAALYAQAQSEKTSQVVTQQPLPAPTLPQKVEETPVTSAPSSAPNPLMRPTLARKQKTSNTATPEPVNESNMAATLSAPLPNTSGATSIPAESGSLEKLPRFDGWYVSYVSNEIAVLRASEFQPTTADGPKAGSPGFGTVASTDKQSFNQMVGTELEVENNQSFNLNDELFQVKIKNGLVTLFYLGRANAAFKPMTPVTVFSGRVSSRPLRNAIELEKSDAEYESSVQPATNSVTSAQGRSDNSTNTNVTGVIGNQ